MKALLVANQPDKTTRLQMFAGTLRKQGHDVIIPEYSSRNWGKIALETKKALKKIVPDVVHLFNVPDILYYGIEFPKLIYDYRSPWGVEVGTVAGRVAKNIAERFEKHLAKKADIITTPNKPLAEKVKKYNKSVPINIIPNYSSQDFAAKEMVLKRNDGPILFVGRISKHEGIENLLNLVKKIPERQFWIVGDGPFARWYCKDLPSNVTWFGWVPHDSVTSFISASSICLIPIPECEITKYATEKSVWKLNEYLSCGKTVIASGISEEEDRKNLKIVFSNLLEKAIREAPDDPLSMNVSDYRYWEQNEEIIKGVYESI